MKLPFKERTENTMQDKEFSEKIKDMIVHEAKLHEGSLFLFAFKDGKKYRLDLEPEGDCCAQAWIESVNELHDLIGAKLQGWDHVSSRSDDSMGGRLDYDFFKFVTDTGYVDVELRTDHNGYYSGWINLAIYEVN